MRTLLIQQTLPMLLVCVAACTSAQRPGRDEPTSQNSYDGGLHDGTPLEDGGIDGDIVMPSDSSAGDQAVGSHADVIARRSIEDGGGELLVEAREGGLDFRLLASDEEAIAVEPTGHLDGPSTAALFFGPGCRLAKAGRSVLLGSWTGELQRCVTSTQPLAVMAKGGHHRHGCDTERATPGQYELSIWPCGRYDEPLVTVSFKLAPLPGQPIDGPEEPSETKAPSQVSAPSKTQVPSQASAPSKTKAPSQASAPSKTQVPSQVSAPSKTKAPSSQARSDSTTTDAGQTSPEQSGRQPDAGIF